MKDQISKMNNMKSKKSQTPTLQDEEDSECDTLPSDVEESFQEKYPQQW